MNKQDLQVTINRLLPELYKFSVVVSPDTLLAEQCLLDAITVFILNNINFLEAQDYQEDKRSTESYIYSTLINEIYLLIQSKSVIQVGASTHFTREYENFSHLNCEQRAIIFLKEIKGEKLKDIQKLLGLTHSKLIEAYYNGKNKLMHSKTIYNQREDTFINSYVYETLPKRYHETLEAKLVEDESLREFYQLKTNEKEFFKEFIPNPRIDKKVLADILRECVSTINELMPKENISFLNKVSKAMTKPLFKFEV